MARFQPAETFHPAEGTFQLLPLRFERTGKLLLVSNMVGDFIRLSGDEMNRIIELNVSPGDGLYEKAYAGHLIAEEVKHLNGNCWPCDFAAGWHSFARPRPYIFL